MKAGSAASERCGSVNIPPQCTKAVYTTVAIRLEFCSWVSPYLAEMLSSLAELAVSMRLLKKCAHLPLETWNSAGLTHSKLIGQQLTAYISTCRSTVDRFILSSRQPHQRQQVKDIIGFAALTKVKTIPPETNQTRSARPCYHPNMRTSSSNPFCRSNIATPS